jgi:REP element-mobilizing transposase RayT
MRVSRNLLKDSSRHQVFHVVSRIVDRRLIFRDEERECFVRIMRKYEGFCGVEVLAFCVMGNHFHILLRIPEKPSQITESEIWRRMKHIYSPQKIKQYETEWEEWSTAGMSDRQEEFLNCMRQRMYDLSVFLQELKQRFSKWYNFRSERKGTLWEERFRSVLLEGKEGVLKIVAAYIDLNPVRAGLVQDPKDYPWSSYGEACLGGTLSRRGLARILSGRGPNQSWPDLSRSYRVLLLSRVDSQISREEREIGSPGIKDGQIIPDDKLHVTPEKLRHKIRAFTDGLVIGSEEYLEHFHKNYYLKSVPGRKGSGEKIKELGTGLLRSFRRVQ